MIMSLQRKDHFMCVVFLSLINFDCFISSTMRPCLLLLVSIQEEQLQRWRQNTFPRPVCVGELRCESMHSTFVWRATCHGCSYCVCAKVVVSSLASYVAAVLRYYCTTFSAPRVALLPTKMFWGQNVRRFPASGHNVILGLAYSLPFFTGAA